MQGKRTNVTRVLLEKLLKFGLSSLIFAVALCLGLIVINYIAAVKTPNIDITRNKVNTLSMESTTLIDDINFNVEIKAFYTLGTERRIRKLLDKYVDESDKLKYEFIDPLKNPIMAERYDVSQPRTIIFETAGKQTRINPPPRGQQILERDVTIALYRLLTDETKTVYFTVGHGEYSLENTRQSGLSYIKDKLAEQNYVVEEVNLLEEGTVPEDCNLLITVGASVPFTDEEEEIVRDFLNNEGSAMFMIPPGIDPNLDDVFKYYGINFGDNYVYETSSRMTTEMFGPISPLVSAQDEHEITANLENQNFLFPFVRSVEVAREIGNIIPTRLLASSANSWAESDMQSAKTVRTNQKPTRDEGETKGPITVAVVAERVFDLPDSLIKYEVTTFNIRSAFFGNATFVTNQFASTFPSNINLFLNTVNWITRNEKIIEITPHLDAFTPIELRQSQRKLLSWLTLIIFPSSILIVGIVVWYRRR